MRSKTIAGYEKYLNELRPSYDSELWIIGGCDKRRTYYPNRYGTALKANDPIAFQVGFNEWKLN